ncbi:MAG: hypothetical protein CME38_08725 [Haliea sp.]|nr:hypothetical protein [Haliea sp.]
MSMQSSGRQGRAAHSAEADAVKDALRSAYLKMGPEARQALLAALQRQAQQNVGEGASHAA